MKISLLNLRRDLLQLGLLTTLGSTSSVNATVTPVFNPADVGASHAVDWDRYGTEFDSLPNPLIRLDYFYNGVTISTGNEVMFELLDEGSGWVGNFKLGDHLLFGSGTTFTLQPKFVIQGIGLQLQPGPGYLGAFEVQVEAFDKLGISLGIFDFSGISSDFSDGSALFVGLHSDVNDMAQINYRIIPGIADSFAINTVIINDVDGDFYTPESGTGAAGILLGAMVLGHGWRRARRRDERSESFAAE